MIGAEQFLVQIDRFHCLRPDYVRDFDEFWMWKIEVESRDRHLLDGDHIEGTHERLYRILRRWQHRRRSGNDRHWFTFRESLGRISGALDQIRSYSLLELDGAPEHSLVCIWHELGRIKEPDGDMNPSARYLAISVCKPLMLLWGQTMAFDRNVRGALPARYGVSATHYRWLFEKWMRVMEGLRTELEENPELVELIRTMSWDKYGTSSVVPYGRFFDMYYWSSGSPS